MILLITAAVMAAATMMQHLGLTEAIGKVVLKVLQCNMCCTFWATLAVTIMVGSPIWLCALMAITAAYASNWFALLLAVVDKLFDKLWQRLQNRKK